MRYSSITAELGVLPGIAARVLWNSHLALLLGTLWILLSSTSNRVQGEGVEVPDDVLKMPVVERITAAPVFIDRIVFVGENRPDEQDSNELWDAIESLRQRGPLEGMQFLEDFINTHPKSQWTPSLHACLGHYYRRIGRYTRAIQHWELAWAQSSADPSPGGLQVAENTLAQWTRLLTSLGRIETLTQLYEQSKDHVFKDGALQAMMNINIEAYAIMRGIPGIAYRCGSIALFNVGSALKGDPNALRAIFEAESPSTGFSVTQLQEFSDRARLDMTAAFRTPGAPIVVPSVIHWRLDHYGAIVGVKDGKYLVQDPTLDGETWLDAQTIEEEASGIFLVPRQQLTRDWRPLTKEETDSVFGRGFPTQFDDNNPEDCPKDEDGDGPDDTSNPATELFAANFTKSCEIPICPGSGGTNPGQSDSDGCATCGDGDSELPGGEALPKWKVTEPNINLWINDIPIVYTKSYGKRQIFKLSYKQRNTRSTYDTFSVGPQWEFNRLSYVRRSPDGSLTHWVAGGGKRRVVDGVIEYKSRQMPFVTTSGSTVIRVGFSSPEGSGSSFGQQFNSSYGFTLSRMDGTTDFFIGTQTNRFGQKTSYSYTHIGGNLLLNHVNDHDGKKLYFGYGHPNRPSYVTQVSDQYGKTAYIGYNAHGRLSAITNAAGMQSVFEYDGLGRMYKVTTPYGSTYFFHTENIQYGPGQTILNPYDVHRACRVQEPTGRTHLFVYRYNCSQLNTSDDTSFIALSALESEKPQLPASVPAITMSTSSMYYHNSFYWNGLNYSSINAAFRGSPSNFDLLTIDDYYRARNRQWLTTSPTWTEPGFLGGTLNMERTPCEERTGPATPGQTTWYGYDGKGVLSYAEGTNSLPSVVARRRPDGVTEYTLYEFNSRRNLSRIEANYGDGSTVRSRAIEYHPGDLLVKVVRGWNGERVHGYAYFTDGQVQYHTNAVGEVTTFTKDVNNRIYRRTTHAGLVTDYTWSAGDGFISHVVDSPVSRTRSYTYLGSFLRTYTDPRGLMLTYTYDALQRPTVISYPGGTTETISYTTPGGAHRLEKTKVIDRMGYVQEWEYNGIKQLTKYTDRRGYPTTYTYCPCGTLETVKNALNQTTTFTYDNRGYRTKIQFGDNTYQDFRWNALGQLDKKSDALSTWTYAYNVQGLQTSETNSTLGLVESTAYDIRDFPATRLDSNGVTTTYTTVDDLGRVRVQTYVDNTTEQFVYSAWGLTHFTDRRGRQTEFTYDELGRKKSRISPNPSETVQYDYNAAGDLTTLTDELSRVTRWEYDIYGNLKVKRDANNVKIIEYWYNDNHHLTARWMIEGNKTTVYTPDQNGNVTNIDYPISPDISFVYDALNRPTIMNDASGQTLFQYTNSGNLYTEDGPFGQDTVTYGYHPSVPRLRSSMTLNQPSGSWTQTYETDAALRPEKVVTPAGIFRYYYSLNTGGWIDTLPKTSRRWTALQYPSFHYTARLHDNQARVTWQSMYTVGGSQVSATFGGITHQLKHEYNAYFENGTRRIQTFPDGQITSYWYDNEDQLISATGSFGTASYAYTYDKAHNLDQRAETGVANQNFVVNNLNQLTTTPYGNAIYDLNGNLIYYNNRYYFYDDENQLIQIADYNLSPIRFVSFAYDGLRRKRRQVEYTWNGSTWVPDVDRLYVYDGRQVIQERDQGNLPQVMYTWGQDLSGSREGAGGIGGLLCRSTGYSQITGGWSTHRYVFSDDGGNVTALIDSSTSGMPGVEALYKYDPYGRQVSAYGNLAASNTYRFSTKEYHPLFEVYGYGYRFYEPKIQRWLNRDPIEESGGRNLYGFVLNSPINSVDSDGRYTTIVLGLTAVGIYFSMESYVSAPAVGDPPIVGRTGNILQYLPLAHTLCHLTKASMSFALAKSAVSASSGLNAAKKGDGIVGWWNKGSEADAAWRALPIKDKVFYEIGQKTLPGSQWTDYAKLDAVARGRALVQDKGWLGALTPQGSGWRLGAGTTLPTGPTPLVRWAAPRVVGAGVGAGVGYYLNDSDN